MTDSLFPVREPLRPALTPPSRLLLLLEGRALAEFGAFWAALPLLAFAPRGDGHPVLVLPGLIASDVSTRPLVSFLRGRGYDAVGWGQGRNFGPRPGLEERMIARLRDLGARHGRKVSLIGWSLGGLYARQLASRLPDEVRQVITLGSPIRGETRASRAGRLYEWVSGRSADEDRAVRARWVESPPPVPLTAVWSRSDGVCHWRNCVEAESATAENIEVESSHVGLVHHPAVAYAVADRLAEPEGGRRKFERTGWRAHVYRDPGRG